MIVQAGWNDIGEEDFKNIAKEAEKQAKLAKLVEDDEEEEEEEEEEEGAESEVVGSTPFLENDSTEVEIQIRKSEISDQEINSILCSFSCLFLFLNSFLCSFSCLFLFLYLFSYIVNFIFVFLQFSLYVGAALANIRVIVQAGWNDIGEEDFKNIAKEAEKQAKLAKLVEDDEEEEEEEEEEGAESEVVGSTPFLENDGTEVEIQIRKSEISDQEMNSIEQKQKKMNKTMNNGRKSFHLKSTSSNSNGVWTAAKDALLIGACPHSWLFKMVAAVVHHGGAGMVSCVERHKMIDIGMD